MYFLTPNYCYFFYHFLGFGMHDNSSDVVVMREEEVCDNGEQLKAELAKRKKQWTEQETAYEKAMQAVEMRLIEERKKK